MKGDDFFILNNEQDSVPRSSAGSGTITSVNNGMILGAATAFKSEANIDDFIYIKAQNDFRKIDSIISDTEIILDRPFTTPLAASAFDITPASKFTEISGLVSGAGDTKLDGNTLAVDEDFSFNKAGKVLFNECV